MPASSETRLGDWSRVTTPRPAARGVGACTAPSTRPTRPPAHRTIERRWRAPRPQYELYYVAAEERDVIGVRTNQRGEQVYLYRLETGPVTARSLLLDYVASMDELATHARWYNALTQNCTTTIQHHARQIAAGKPWDWRILVNGKLDELGYARGQIDTSLPFEELRRRSDITERARAADQAPDFSARIREGLPGFPHPTAAGGHREPAERRAADLAGA